MAQKSGLIIYELLFSQLKLPFVVGYYERLRVAVMKKVAAEEERGGKKKKAALMTTEEPGDNVTGAMRWKKARAIAMTLGRLEVAAGKRKSVRSQIFAWEEDRKSRGDPTAEALFDTMDKLARFAVAPKQQEGHWRHTSVNFKRRSTVEITDPSSPFFRQRGVVRKISNNNRMLSIAFTGQFGQGMDGETQALQVRLNGRATAYYSCLASSTGS